MFKKIISIVSAAALGVCCLTGCSNEAAPEKEAKELKKITVAEVTHSVFYAPQYVAMSQGFFEEGGLEIDLVNAQGGRFEIDIDGDLFKSVVEFNLID